MNYKQNFTEEEVQDVESFLMGMTHHAQKALTLLAGYAELLRDGSLGPLTGEQENAMRVICNSIPVIRDHIISPYRYFYLLSEKPIDWQCVALNTVVTRAIQQVTPYLAHNSTVKVNMPLDAPVIVKGDETWLPTAITGLLYKGRHRDLSLKFEMEQPGIIKGKVDTVYRSELDRSSEIFQPGRRSGQWLSISKMIFEHYGSPVEYSVLSDGYEFVFHLFTCDEETKGNV